MTVLSYETRQIQVGQRSETAELLSKLGPLIGLIFVVALFSALAPGTFSKVGNFELILRQTAVVGTAALGMTLIIISGGIDLSVGSAIALGTVVIARFLGGFRFFGLAVPGSPPALAAVEGVIVVVLCGMIIGVLITRLKLAPFIITLGMFGALRGTAKGLAQNSMVYPPATWLDELLRAIGPRAPVAFIVITAICVITAFLLWLGATILLGFRLIRGKSGPYWLSVTLLVASLVMAVVAILTATEVIDLHLGWGPALLFAIARLSVIVALTVDLLWQAARGRVLRTLTLACSLILGPFVLVAIILMRLPMGVWLMLFLAVGVAALLRYTRFGRHVFAIGSNEQTARLCGVNIERTKLFIYMLAAAFTGMAAVLQFSYLTMGDPTTATGMELDIIAAVVIGGASLSGGQGSVLGSLVGALIMTIVSNGCTKLGLENWVQEIVTGGIIIFAVALDRLRQKHL